jgi:hypothetical protein
MHSLPYAVAILAYLDPGAGSMMLQVLLGGSAAVLVLLKLTWRRLLSLVGFRRPSLRNPPTVDNA